MKKIKVFTSNDLDGAGSLMLIKWIFGDMCEIDYTITNIFSIKNDYSRLDDSNYSKVFILNMTPTFEVSDNVLTFTKSDKLDLSFAGKVNIATSTTDLISHFFAKSLKNLTISQIEFIYTINAFYIDGGHKQDAIKLNAIFSFGRNKYSAFYDRFANGITDYTDREEEIISNYKSELLNTYKHVELFKRKTSKDVYIALVPNMNYKHEILDLLFKKLSPNIVFMADLDSGFISVRKSSKLDIDMNILCDKLIEGRSLRNCAGGKYTERFIDFSKEFV